jgi:hypothetical protein
MDNPLDFLKQKFDDLAKQVRHDVEVAILEEQTAWILSRLMTLNPDKASVYQSAVHELQG